MAQPLAVTSDRLVFGNIVIDAGTYSVSVDGRPVDLTFYEFELLRQFCYEANRIIDHDVLCDVLWSSKGQKERRRLNVAVCRLRAKLTDSQPYRLETVRGRGYGLLAPAASI